VVESPEPGDNPLRPAVGSVAHWRLTDHARTEYHSVMQQ